MRRTDLVEIWDARAGTRVVVLRTERTSVESLCYSPDGALVAAGTLDHTVDVWEARTTVWLGAVRSGVPQDARTEAAVRQVVFTPDGRSLLAVTAVESGSCLAQRWAVARRLEADGSPRLTATPLPPLDTRGRVLRSIGVDPGGRGVAGGTESGAVLAWDAQSGALARTFEPDGRLQPWVSFLDDDSLGVAGHDATMAADGATWDSSSRRLQPLGAPSDTVTRMVLAPDGSLAAGATEHSVLALWNGRDGTLLASLGGHKAPVRAMAFSPQGRLLVSAGADHGVHVWDVASRGLLQKLQGTHGGGAGRGLQPRWTRPGHGRGRPVRSGVESH